MNIKETDRYIITFNGGSSSLKFALYPLSTSNGDECFGSGHISAIGEDCVAKLKLSGTAFNSAMKPPDNLMSCFKNAADAAQSIISWLMNLLPKGAIAAVGHRVVHGGARLCAEIVTPAMLDDLRKLIPLAPLHEPHNISIIEKIAEIDISIPQVACFDTSFHTTMPHLHNRLPIQKSWHNKGVRRYGFHGLSYDYISGRLATLSKRAFSGRTVVAHLGNGASLCAMKAGLSFDTSMGFSAIDGLMMGTRTGSIDPGVILHFLNQAGLNPQQIEEIIWRESGLLGVSGISSDMAVLLASKETSAAEAVNLFLFRLTKEIGAMANILGGIDALIFTGGIGENAAAIRSRTVSAMGWLGLKIDDEYNISTKNGQTKRISTGDSTAEIWVIPTDEESVIARETRKLL